MFNSIFSVRVDPCDKWVDPYCEYSTRVNFRWAGSQKMFFQILRFWFLGGSFRLVYVDPFVTFYPGRPTQYGSIHVTHVSLIQTGCNIYTQIGFSLKSQLRSLKDICWDQNEILLRASLRFCWGLRNFLA